MKIVFMLFSLIMMPLALAQTATDKIDTVVFVHGAFADGSSWNKVITSLQKSKINVISVQNPLTSLADDAAAAKRVIEAQPGKVLLVGHSWGGAVISEAGNNEKVAGLVYVAAFAPNDGQSANESVKAFPAAPGIQKLSPDTNGYISLSKEIMATDFAQDLKKDETNLMTATQGPIAGKCFDDKVTTAAWKTKPNWYIVTSKDRMINPDAQKNLAKQMNATVTTIGSSHVPMISRPKEVAKVITDALKKLNSQVEQPKSASN
ncbi:alpha/beta fold hydrolase [Peredibacter starrii]|uniref:Alpha/beta hydrolase n=1 Tax=Peredibacter starrii TaxID=28202 RepID=A0AAX4HUC5_9BACT|nr:alpha/beta hydrolase [Peredibacter starrii]WPU66821.1 alpha/beta hydrolase [Peredibacter starrii]